MVKDNDKDKDGKLSASEIPERMAQGLERIDTKDLTTTVEKTAVYARVAPKHKLQLVQILQDKGHIVAMTGDGVNDAPVAGNDDAATTKNQPVTINVVNNDSDIDVVDYLEFQVAATTNQ